MAGKSDWEEILKKAHINARKQEIHERNTLRRFVESLKKVLSVELLIGIIAAFSLYFYFGWDELFKILLSWIIGITMVSTIITFMVDRYKKLLHLRR